MLVCTYNSVSAATVSSIYGGLTCRALLVIIAAIEHDNALVLLAGSHNDRVHSYDVTKGLFSLPASNDVKESSHDKLCEM